MYGVLLPGDVVLADALFDNYFLACELRERGIELVARVQAERVGSRTVEVRPDGEVVLWQRPNKPRGMTGEQYRRYPKSLLMRQVSVDAREENNRAGQFKVVTTLLDAAIDGGQIGDLFERRWSGEIDIRSTAFAPKLEAAPSEQRAAMVDAMLKAVEYQRVFNRPGRWEPRAAKRRPKPRKRLGQPRRVAKLALTRKKWY
jgi:hypothetical protein